MRKNNLIEGIKLYFDEGTTLHVLFENGITKQYDMEDAIKDIPQLEPLRNRHLFLKGRLDLGGIVWTDEIDYDVHCVYILGKEIPNNDERKELYILGYRIWLLRTQKHLSQQQLSKLTGIDQSDISKLERGELNPSVMQIKKIAKALNADLKITLK